MNNRKQTLKKLIETKKAKVGTIGLGYAGLPITLEFAKAGFVTYGFDIDSKKINALKNGNSYIKHIAPDLIKELVAKKQFRPQSSFTNLKDADAIIICVPTPVNKNNEPDLSCVTSTAKTVREHVRPGQLVILESTTYPGTTDELVKPILEDSGLKAGSDFFLAFSPEREDPGNRQFNTHQIPKVVGGIDKASTELTALLYGSVVEKVVPVSSAKTAEACKILENIYRAVNIALVNELKMLFDRMGIDIWEVIKGASTKPFGFHPFYPGPGWGGHCIPVDPFYLSWKARQYGFYTHFIELAGEINTKMPNYVVSKVMDALNGFKKPVAGSKILILGMAYKKDIDDIRESPSLVLAELLQQKGASVSYHDPFIPAIPSMRRHNFRATSVTWEPEVISGFDCVVIATAHSFYDPEFIGRHAKLVIDTRNLITNSDCSAKVIKA